METARSSRRRERKMKFDLKSVLNIRTTPPPTPSPPQSNADKSLKHNKSKTDSRRYSGKSGVESVNKSPVGAKNDQSVKDGRTEAETSVKDKSVVKKDLEGKSLSKKKQVTEAIRRKDEIQKKNKTTVVNSVNDTSHKGKLNPDSRKPSKDKSKPSKNSLPVTNGKDSVEKKKKSKGLNNSSKSNLDGNTVISGGGNEGKLEMHSSKSVEVVQPVTGKRERKRKKFWDEEEFFASLPPTKISKKKSVDVTKKEVKNVVADSLTRIINKTKNKRISEGAISNLSMFKSKNTDMNSKQIDLEDNIKISTKGSNASDEDIKLSSVKTTKKEDNLSKKHSNQVTFNSSSSSHISSKHQKSENGKVLLYMTSFDMTEDPSNIAAKMKEGVNIPGPGVSIPVDSSRLPKGWEKRVIQRGIGVTKGKWDVFIVEEEGRKSFRSKTDLQRHIDEKKLPYTSDAFDFSLDDNLKKLRQIWKQYIVKPRLKPGEKMSPSIPAKKGKKKNEGVTALSFFEQSSHPSSLSRSPPTSQSQQTCPFDSPNAGMSPIGVDPVDLKKVTYLL